LSRWQAFNALWRQQWHPASEDERGIRVAGIVVSLAAHLFFFLFLAYLAYVRIMALPMDEEAASTGEDVVQVEYIGEGTPDEEGGGPPPGEEIAEQASAAASPQPVPQPAPPQPQPQPQERQAEARPTPPAIARPEPAPPRLAPVPESVVQVPPVDQPLAATETPEP